MTLTPPLTMLVLYSVVAITFIPMVIFASGWLLAFYDYINMVSAYLGIGITLYMSFQVRAIFNEHIDEKKTSCFCTFFFHIWYLQYKINKFNEYN